MNVGSVGSRGRLPPSNFTKQLVKCLYAPFSIVPIVCEGAPRMCTQLFDCFLLPCIWLSPLNWLLHSLHFRPVLVPLSTDYFCVCIKMTKSSTQLSCIRYVMFIRAHTYCHTHIATPTRFWLSPGQISLWICLCLFVRVISFQCMLMHLPLCCALYLETLLTCSYEKCERKTNY